MREEDHHPPPCVLGAKRTFSSVPQLQAAPRRSLQPDANTLRRIAVSSSSLDWSRCGCPDRRIDYLHGFAFEAIGDLLNAALLILDCALDKLLGQPVDLLRLSLPFGSTRFSSRRSASVNIFSPIATRIT